MAADLDEFAMAKLAREMAMGIRNYQAIFADYGIDETDYQQIEKNEFYRRAREQFALEWNSALSAADRVRLISAAYAEQTLVSVGRGILDENKPLSDRLDGFKTLCRNAGIGDPKTPVSNPAERFIITINMGADTETYDKSITIDATPEQPKIEAPKEKSLFDE